MRAVQVLLSDCIDYAGLFPPASLDLRKTVENYASYRAGSSAWALGRAILPREKVREFAQGWPAFAADWPIALLLRGDAESELQRWSEGGFDMHIAAVECGPLRLQAIPHFTSLLPPSVSLYIEVDMSSDPGESITAIAAAGARAKVRTGGIVRAAIPSTADVVRFLACCIQHRVGFKATAGLHHAVRGLYPLTYKPEGEEAMMHGFLNVLLASALLADGGDAVAATALLEETSLASFEFSDEHVRWRDWTVTARQLSYMRKNVMMSFGSCSFTEPLEEMRSAGLVA